MSAATVEHLPTLNGNGFTSIANSHNGAASLYSSQNGAYVPFKERRSFEMRQRDVMEIKKKHPNKVPLVIERGKSERSLRRMDKTKFLVPEEITISQLLAILRKRIDVSDSQAFFLVINNKSLASGNTTLGEVYRQEKDTDGFLYIAYSSQETFG